MDFIPIKKNENNAQLPQNTQNISNNQNIQLNQNITNIRNNQNDDLKNEINRLRNENNILKNEINSLKNENKALNNKIQNLNNSLASFNKINLELKNKNEIIKNLNYEIVKLRAKKDQIIKREDMISIQFKSTDQKVDIAIPCLITDTFVRIEEIIYEQYPEYKDINTFFTVGGGTVKRFRSIQENNIKNYDKILLNVYEEII